MKAGTVLLTNREGRVFGSVDLDKVVGDLRLGLFHPVDWPDELRALFEEYEDVINDQILAVVDLLEDKIAERGFCVMVPGAETIEAVADLQIMRNGLVSFRLASER